MAKPLQNITLSAPAFKGLNTQDTPISIDPQFAAVADNLVIDRYGRLGARKGYVALTTDVTALDGNPISQIHEYEETDGTLTVVSVGNNKVFTGKETLTDITGGATITDNDWHITTFNNKCYLFQEGHMPLVYDGTTLSNNTNAPQGHCVLAAFGRIWTGGVVNDKQTVYWSDLLDGTSWTTGSSGLLNLAKVWPDGYDEVVGLAAYNNNLVIFGRDSIVVYTQAEDPATMVLMDTIDGIGCVDRNTIQQTGEDLIFLSKRGLQSLSRLIQEKSMPMRDISKNVRDDIMRTWELEEEGVRSVYSASNAFYLITFQGVKVTYCFDLRATLEDGSQRCTTWSNTPFNCFATTEANELLVGNADGVGKYVGYSDNGEQYLARYYSHPLSFGDPSILKVLKKIRPVFIGGSNVICSVLWAFDYNLNFSSATARLKQSIPAYYAIDEYNDAEYSSGVLTSSPNINASGSGGVVTVAIETRIQGEPLSIQQINIQAITGKLL